MTQAERGTLQTPVASTRPSVSTVSVVLLVVITGVGVGVRVPGWQGGGLYYDDAWFALPSRVPLSTALHMIVTAPGYTLLQAGWIHLAPSSTRFAMLLPLLAACAAVPLAFVMGRTFRFPTWASLVIAALVAAEPVAIEYATRVKSYEAELVIAIVVLATAEVVRRRRTTAAIVSFGVLSVGAIVMSTALIAVVAGCWVALIVVAILDRRQLRSVLVTALVAGLCSVPVVLWITAKIPPALTAFWVGNDRLVAAPFSPHHLIRVLAVSGGGFLHGVIGTPMPQPAGGVDSLGIGDVVLLGLASALALALLVVLSLPTLRAVATRDPSSPDLAQLAPVMVILIAFLEFLVGIVPLGTGRTDLYLLPAVLVLVGAGLVRLAAWVAVRTPPGRSARIGVALAVGAGLLGTALAWHQRAWYPVQAVAQLEAEMSTATSNAHPVEVITYRNSFTWAFDRLSPFRVHFSRTAPAASTVGYWVTFADPHVRAQLAGSGEIPGLRSLKGTNDLWLVGTTAATLQPSTIHPVGRAAEVAVPTGAAAIIESEGWHATTTTVRAPGVVAQLFVRSARP